MRADTGRVTLHDAFALGLHLNFDQVEGIRQQLPRTAAEQAQGGLVRCLNEC